MLTEEPKYEEWLTTIVNTRLLFDTMKGFEDMMGNHSIHDNGIKRCFSTPQKMRGAFRDLKVEVSLMTDGALALDKVMEQYKEAWKFYKGNLSRRSNPADVALELLGKKKLAIFEQVVEHDICVTFLVLMLLKAIPGYDSKEGDATSARTGNATAGDAYDGFERIQLDDNVGTLKMDGKTYLAFDEFLLYIGTSRKELKKYGITKVDCIE